MSDKNYFGGRGSGVGSQGSGVGRYEKCLPAIALAKAGEMRYEI